MHKQLQFQQKSVTIRLDCILIGQVTTSLTRSSLVILRARWRTMKWMSLPVIIDIADTTTTTTTIIPASIIERMLLQRSIQGRKQLQRTSRVSVQSRCYLQQPRDWPSRWLRWHQAQKSWNHSQTTAKRKSAVWKSSEVVEQSRNAGNRISLPPALLTPVGPLYNLFVPPGPFILPIWCKFCNMSCISQDFWSWCILSSTTGCRSSASPEIPLDVVEDRLRYRMLQVLNKSNPREVEEELQKLQAELNARGLAYLSVHIHDNSFPSVIFTYLIIVALGLCNHYQSLFMLHYEVN